MKIFIIIFFSIQIVQTVAQKLPNKQKVSIWVKDVKVDGKAEDWNNQFAAYNTATDIFYTIANNDKWLYLVVQTDAQDIINRIVGGGITFTIQEKDKKEGNGISITYPVLDEKTNLVFNLRGRKGYFQDTTSRAADSIMIVHNNMLLQKCKSIKVKDIHGIDSLISVYNENGIKAVGLFNNKKVYTLELAILIKRLEFPENTSRFNYHIVLNGAKPTPPIVYTRPGETDPKQIEALQRTFAQMNAYNSNLSAPTDFWAEYTLAKAP